MLNAPRKKSSTEGSAFCVVRAEFMGFCGGVENAVLMTEEAVARYGALGRAVYSCGPVIHNAAVMEELAALGLRAADSLDEVPDGAVVVVRSHGEGPAFFEEARRKGCEVVDTTCPKVARIHRLAEQARIDGYRVIIFGDAQHPEVRAIKEWGGGPLATVVSDMDEVRQDVAEAYEQGARLFVVSQTTFDREAFDKIALEFDAVDKGLVYRTYADPNDPSEHGDFVELEWIQVPVTLENTICEATSRRQEACRILARDADAMVVVGGRHSSNTRKLYEIAQNYCKNVLFIENKCEISLKDLCGCNKIGVTAGASTPERIVKEVISSMSEFRSENYENNPMHEYMDEIDKSTRLPRNGDVVTGEVILVTDNDVTINLGCKKDGVIPRYEVSFEEGQTMHDVFKEGDEVQAKVLKNDDGEGNILLSKKRVIVSEHWETISQACDDKTPLEVRVTREVNGGVIAAFNEVNGFIPLSQLSDHYVEKADEFVGQTLVVKVIRVDQKRNKVVFSHKAVLHEARQKRMQEIWESLSVGDVIDGKVMRFTEYGAFVDIGGVDGLLHISEISWGKLRHPSDLLGINQEIKVKILSMNKEKEKISLGYKQNQPEPWSVINQKYTVGQVISGRAVQIKDYGVFVEIEPGLDGLVHISEIAYRRVTDISDELDVGQLVSAKILEIDQDRKRISLSIKETLDKPSDDNEVFAVAGAEPGDPSTEGFDPDKDQEFEIPDPDGLDVAEADADAVEAEMEIEVEAIEADAEIEIEVDAIEADAEVEVEIEVDADAEIEIEVEAIEADAEVEIEVDAIGADAEVEIEVETAAVDAIAEADPGDPSTEAFDPDKDQEFEIPDPDGADAAEAKDDEA